MKLPLSIVALAFSALTASTAFAQTRTVQTADYSEKTVNGDQVVKFTGDELAGMANGPYGNLIRRPPGITKVGLIRPRVNFVPELLVSVENL